MDIHSFFDTMMLDGRQTQDDPALLVVVRQSLVLTVGLLLLLAAFLSRQSSSIHLWLEGSWWLVATSMATVLMITGKRCEGASSFNNSTLGMDAV